MNNELYETVIELYLKNHSVKDTAEQLKLSIVKVRRILITEGLWVSKRSKEIGELLEIGLTTEEIARQLGLTVKNVQQYIPYSRGLYTEKSTSDSVRSSIYRSRKKEAAQNVKGIYQMGEIIDLSKYLTKKAMLIEQNRQLVMGKSIPKAPLAEKIYTLKLELAERDVFAPQRFKELELAGSSRKDFHKLTKSNIGISRTVQVPAKMPLNALNYLIQRAFGLQNSHLHAFLIDGNDLKQLTNNSFPQWQQFCGYLFRCPIEHFADRYFADDYDGSKSIKSWLKDQYTGLYSNYCASDTYLKQQEYLKNLANTIKNSGNASLSDIAKQIILPEPFGQLLERLTVGEVFTLEPIKPVVYKNLVAESVKASKLRAKEFGGKQISELLESIENYIQEYENMNAIRSGNINMDDLDDSPEDYISDCLFFIEKLREFIWPMADIINPEVTPQFKEIYYNYDFGDDWIIKITCLAEEKGKLEQPVCIDADGLNLIEDAGGIDGYLNVLRVLAGDGAPQEVSEMKAWARWQGFTGRRNKPVHIL